jgi:hypothetical protein
MCRDDTAWGKAHAKNGKGADLDDEEIRKEFIKMGFGREEKKTSPDAEPLDPSARKACEKALLELIDRSRELKLTAIALSERSGAKDAVASASSLVDKCAELQNTLVDLYRTFASCNAQTPEEIEQELDKIRNEK